MPKLFLRTTMAGPDGVRYPGWHQFDDATADTLLEAGHAVPNVGSETASVAPAEQAVMPRPSRKRG